MRWQNLSKHLHVRPGNAEENCHKIVAQSGKSAEKPGNIKDFCAVCNMCFPGDGLANAFEKTLHRTDI